MADSKEKLFSDFPPVSTQEWMDKVMVDLKGADYEKKLVWKTNEGFKVKPFYRQEDLEGLKTTEGLPGEFPYIRGNKKNDNTWYIRQDIRVEDAKEANAKALDILNKGADSLGFSVKKTDLNEEFIRTLLCGLECECIELNFSTCQRHTLMLARLLTGYFKEKGYDPEKIHGSLNFDPISKMLQKGKDVSGVIAFGKDIAGNLLTNFQQKQVWYLSIVKFAYALVILFSNPVVAYLSVVTIDRYLFTSERTYLRRLAESLVWCTVVWFLAIMVPQLDVVFSFTGSTGGILLIYVLPSLYYLAVVKRLRKRNDTKSLAFVGPGWLVPGAYILIGFSILLGIVSTVSRVLLLLESCFFCLKRPPPLPMTTVRTTGKKHSATFAPSKPNINEDD